MKILSPNKASLIAFILCCLGLGCTLYLQKTVGLVPCPLCLVQRFIVLILSLLFLAGALYKHTRTGRRYFYSFVLFVASIGTAAAGRHAWLIKHPSLASSGCSADLLTLLNNLPLTETLRLMVQGSGDCAQETWQWHNLNMPEWASILFIALMLIALWQILRKCK